MFFNKKNLNKLKIVMIGGTDEDNNFSWGKWSEIMAIK